LVYNPIRTNLPPEQDKLEMDYKRNLKENYGVDFNHLLTITNVPIKRFKEYLKSQGEYEKYFELLKSNFNPLVLDNLMCRIFLSVGYDGKIWRTLPVLHGWQRFKLPRSVTGIRERELRMQ